MAINPIGSNHASPKAATAFVPPADSETKSIQSEITNKSQRLNRLSSDSEMSAEEKAKKRQEIQKEIAELNRKLRMLRMEQKEEEKKAQKEEEKKNTLLENQEAQITESPAKESEKLPVLKDSKDSEEESRAEQIEKSYIPPQNIQKLLETGTLIQKERIQQSVHRQETSDINILEAEINSDKIYGSDTSAKEEKLASMLKPKASEIRIEEKQEANRQFDNRISGKIVISDKNLY